MSKILFDAGDVLPSLVLIQAYRLLPSDVVWGVQDRKGFILDAEPWTVAEPARVDGDVVLVPSVGGGIRAYIGPETLVLVEIHL